MSVMDFFKISSLLIK